eukprot:51787_1
MSTIALLCIFINLFVMKSQHNYLCNYDKWTSNNIGTWSMNTDDCSIQQTDAYAKGAVTWLGNDANINSLEWSDYSVEVSMSITSESSLSDHGYAGIIFRAQNISNNINGGQYYVIYMVIQDQKPLVISKLVDNHYIEKAFVSSNIVGGAIRSNQQYTLKIVVNRNNFAASFDDNKYTLNWTDDNTVYNKGSVGLRTWKASAMFNSFYITNGTGSDVLTDSPTYTPTYFPTVSTNDITGAPTTVPTYMETNTIQMTEVMLFSTEQKSQQLLSNNSNHIGWIIIAVVVSVSIVIFLCIGGLIGFCFYRRMKYNVQVKNVNECVEEVFIDEENSTASIQK